MTIDLIVSQGRIADRTAGAIRGAARTAQALKHRYGAKAQFIGRTAPADNDDWPVSLPQARETLAGLARAIATSIEAGNLPVIVANTCAASLASLPVVARKHPDAVVLWIDAHGDFTAEREKSRELGSTGAIVSEQRTDWLVRRPLFAATPYTSLSDPTGQRP